jgi:hypothetical protein
MKLALRRCCSKRTWSAWPQAGGAELTGFRTLPVKPTGYTHTHTYPHSETCLRRHAPAAAATAEWMDGQGLLRESDNESAVRLSSPSSSSSLVFSPCRVLLLLLLLLSMLQLTSRVRVQGTPKPRSRRSSWSRKLQTRRQRSSGRRCAGASVPVGACAET